MVCTITSALLKPPRLPNDALLTCNISTRVK